MHASTHRQCHLVAEMLCFAPLLDLVTVQVRLFTHLCHLSLQLLLPHRTLVRCDGTSVSMGQLTSLRADTLAHTHALGEMVPLELGQVLHGPQLLVVVAAPVAA